MMVSRTWVQVAALVVLFGFTVLGFLAFRTYETGPPIADRVVSQDGTVIFTGADVTAGQELFLKNGLMEYGSIFGHGAYLGPDFTADYLHRAAVIATREYGGPASYTAQMQVIKDFKTNQYDAASRTLTYTSAQATAFEEMVGYYANYFGPTSHDKGLVTNAISDRTQIRQLTSFFAWSAWSGSTLRPGKNYSYTNSWPPETLVGNSPPANVLVWSVLSLIALLAGIGALFAAFGRWGDRFGSKGRQAESISFRPPGGVVLTPAQRACAYFFLVVGLLFFIQTMVGAASEHYRVDITSFFGFDLARWLPYNLVRTWHVQLSIFWTATSFLAAGIFLTPMIAGREPRRQHWLAYGLLGALAVVVFGSMAGEYLDIHGLLSTTFHTFGMQGFEYIDLGRFWQVLLTVGLVIWVIILYRGLRGRLRNESRGNMPWMFFFTALAIPAFYAVGLLASSEDSFTVGAFFSAMEVIPLTFLTVEAWSFLQLGARQESTSKTPFPHRWAVMFLVSVGFWNFLGAGIFGFLVNLPIVSYYEIGTALTANHAHAAMMGVYGMLAMGLALFCLRYLIPAERWPDRLAKISFWSANIGLAWMSFATLLPLGILQLFASVNDGYFAARQLSFITDPTNSVFEWMRMPGDLIFILGGVLPFLYICWLGVRYRVPGSTLTLPKDVLFTEIVERVPVGAGERES